jgi:hypothetical protein
MMITCKTVGCEMGDEKHTPHPDGLIVLCGCCGVEMTPDETPVDEIVVDETVVQESTVDETVVDEPAVEVVIEDE